MNQDADPVRVLVVDHSHHLRDYVVKEVLLPNGYEPLLARDGAEGLHRALSDIPDLILLAWEMPRTGGLQVLEAIHQRPIHIPVILMTSGESQEIPLRVFRMGVRDYVVKPFSPETLLRAMQHATFEVELRRENKDLAGRLAHTRRQLEQRLVELNALHQIGHSVTGMMSLNEVLERIADAALYITGAEECTLMLHDPETGQPMEPVTRQRQASAPRATPDAVSDVPGRPSTTAMLHIPLKIGGTTIGVLSVNNRDSLRTFDKFHQRMLQTLADYAAIAVRTARLGREDAAEGT